MQTVLINKDVIETIFRTVGTHPVESGGVLALQDNRIADFYFDGAAGCGERWYHPTVCDIETVVDKWVRSGYQFAGFLHSHPQGTITLSAMDIVAAEQTMISNRMEQIYMGILCDGQLYFYLIVACLGKHADVIPCEVIVVPGQAQ